MSPNIPTEKLKELNQLAVLDLTGFAEVPPDFDNVGLAQLMADYDSSHDFPKLENLRRCREILTQQKQHKD